jgi:hypothetical protein
MFNNRWYTEHALERMAPSTPEIIELLLDRTIERAKRDNINLEEETINPTNRLKLVKGQVDSLRAWWNSYGPDPRAILPEMVEAEIANPGSTNLKVITSQEGAVITVINKIKGSGSLQISGSLQLSSSSIARSNRPIAPTHEYNYSDKYKILPPYYLSKSAAASAKLSHIAISLYQKKAPPLSMSFAKNEARQKTKMRLFKNIQTIATLDRKRDRDLKMKKYRDADSRYVGYVDLITATDIKRREEAQWIASRLRLDADRLETLLQKIKKIARNKAQSIFRRPKLRPFLRRRRLITLRPRITFKKRAAVSPAIGRVPLKKPQITFKKRAAVSPAIGRVPLQKKQHPPQKPQQTQKKKERKKKNKKKSA